MSEGTLTRTEGETSPVEKIQRGAALDEGQWPAERVAAVVKMLPSDFRTPTNAIALFERAVPAGLNPLSDEIWAWEQHGELQFMVSRDGFLKIASRDPKTTGLEFGHVYEEDEFHFKEEGDGITVHHRGGMKRGDLVGAYCVIHHEEGDHIERRLLSDFEHLQNKQVWRDNEQEMLLTRVISTCVRLKCPETAGLQSEGGMALDERPKRGRAAQSAQEATEDEMDSLAADLAEEEGVDIEPSDEDGGREIEAEAKPADEGKEDTTPSDSKDGSASTEATTTSSGTSEPSTEASTDSSEATPSSEEAEEEPEVEMVVCSICTEDVPKKSIGGHKGGHSRNGYKLPEGVERVVEEGDGYGFVLSETGEVIVAPNEVPFESWEDAVEAAQNLFESGPEGAQEQADAFEQAEPSEDKEEPETDDSIEAEAESKNWNTLYSEVMQLSSEHPDGLQWIREEATALFKDRGVDVNDDGVVQTNTLNTVQLAELKVHLQEEIEQASF